MLTTDGSLLGGRVRYSQPAEGYRTGIEPVLLAASVPARPGQRILEGGAGAGAGLLCLACRVPGVFGIGIEIDPAMAALARLNIEANGHSGLTVETADLATWQASQTFDHAFSNPPWHNAAATPSPLARRRMATHEGDLPLEAWIGALQRPLAAGGTLTLLVPAGHAGRVLTSLHETGFGRVVLIPLWPKPGRDAKLLLVQGCKGRRDPDRITAGLVLHGYDGGFSPAAEALLRDAAPLPI